MKLKPNSPEIMQKFLFIISVCFLFGCSEQVPDYSLAKPYKIVNEWDDGTIARGSRPQHHIAMVSDALTRDELAHTAIGVAYDFYKSHYFDVVTVHIIPDAALTNMGYDLAVASYAPDGKGYTGKDNWVWDASVATIMPSIMDIKIALEWYRFRNEFADKLGNPHDNSEKALRTKIAKSLKIPFDQVHLPWFDLEPYTVKFEAG